METKCYQRVVREREQERADWNLFGRWWETLDLNKREIRNIDRDTASAIIEKYEWLGTLPDNYQYYLGLYLDNALASVVCFTESKFGGKYTLFNKPAICLGRGACVHWSPKWAASYLISNGLKFLFKDKDPLYVVAYSDWSAGEIGTIYQACGWIYLGHNKTREWIDAKGNRYDINTPAVRAMPGFLKRKTGKKVKATPEQIENEKQKMLDGGYKMVDGPIRGKYATVVGKKGVLYKEMREELVAKCKPYPKRDNITP